MTALPAAPLADAGQPLSALPVDIQVHKTAQIKAQAEQRRAANQGDPKTAACYGEQAVYLYTHRLDLEAEWYARTGTRA